MTRKVRNVTRLVVVCLLVASWGLYLRWSANQTRNAPKAVKMTCDRNLTQIGLAFSTWSIDNQDQFPCNVSTNAGGAMELCARGSDGYEGHPGFSFEVMSNELNTPRVLVCPQDKSRKAATNFHTIQPENVTYRLRTGTNISPLNPREVLAICPIDGNTLYCDGTVVGTNRNFDMEQDGLMRLPRGH